MTPGSPGLFSLSSETESYATKSLATTIVAAAAIAAEVSYSLHNYNINSYCSGNMLTTTNPNRNPDNLHNILPASLNRSTLAGLLSQ